MLSFDPDGRPRAFVARAERHLIAARQVQAFVFDKVLQWHIPRRYITEDGQLVDPEDRNAQIVVVEWSGQIVAAACIDVIVPTELDPQMLINYRLRPMLEAPEKAALAHITKACVLPELRRRNVTDEKGREVPRDVALKLYGELLRVAFEQLKVDLVLLDCTEETKEHFKKMGAREFAPAFDNGTGIGACFPLVFPIRDFTWFREHRPNSKLLPYFAKMEAKGWKEDKCANRMLSRLYPRKPSSPADMSAAAVRSAIVPTLPDGSQYKAFEYLTDEQRGLLRPETFTALPGAALMRQADRGRDVYFVKSGLAPVYLERGDEKLLLNKLRAGEVFGEMTYAFGGTRAATIIPKLPTQLEVYSADQLDEMLEALPRDAYRLWEGFCRLQVDRIRRGNPFAIVPEGAAPEDRDRRVGRKATLGWKDSRLAYGVHKDFLGLLRRHRSDAMAGKVILKAGAEVRKDEHAELHIIERGRVRIERDVEGEVTTIATLGVGACFGELSFIDKGKRSANVVAEEPTRVVRISRATVRYARAQHPEHARAFYFNLLQLLTDRLRDLNQLLYVNPHL